MNSRVESSITKLLLATKQLLEVLNSWSYGNAEEHDVSDVYVRLGNEFNLASAAFMSAQIDISDLASIPDDLRVILESTLAEEASPEALELYLPRIRAIIINLLQGLKSKQAEYRARSEHLYVTPHKNRSTTTQLRRPYTSSSPSSGQAQKEDVSAKATPSEKVLSAAADLGSSSSHNASSFFSMTHLITEKHPLHDLSSSSPFSTPNPVAPTSILSSSDLSSSPYPLSSTNESVVSNVHSPRNHAVSSVHGNRVFEKCSRRYSSHMLAHPPVEHISPLQNFSQSSGDRVLDVKGVLAKNSENKSISQNDQSLSMSAYNNLSIEKDSNGDDSQAFLVSKSSQDHMEHKPEPNTFTLFLQFGTQVKKIIHHKNISLDTLRLLFSEKFQYNPCNDLFPQFYIQDPQTKIFYELENLKEITNYSLISLRVQAEDAPNKALEDKIFSLTKELQSLKTSFEEQKEIISEMASRPSTCLSKSTIESFSRQENMFLKMQNHLDVVKNIQQELDFLHKTYTNFVSSMKLSMSDISQKAKLIKEAVYEKLGGSRQFIELGKKKLDAEMQSLVTRIENLSDIVGTLRTDVINRKVRPLPQQLETVRKEEAQIQKEMASFRNHLENLSPCWRQLWETELQNVVEEQEFLAHQENFIEDLKSDIVATMEIFGNIVTYSEYQEKSISHVSSYPLEKNKSIDSVDTSHSEIRNTKFGYDGKANTIPTTNMQKENNFKFYIDKFKNELNEFITETKFKRKGCMDDVEGIRKERDKENLKELYYSIKQSKSDIDGTPYELEQEKMSSTVQESEMESSNKDNIVLGLDASEHLKASF